MTTAALLAPVPSRALPVEADLVARTADGDHDAFAALYRRLAPEVRAFARRRLRDRDRAEELVQDVFLDVWRGAGRYDATVAPVAAWVRTIAARRAVDGARRAAVRPPLAQHEAAEEPDARGSGDPHDRLDVLAGLRSLPTAQRETLALAFYGQLSYPEIAERTDTPLGTVKSRALLGMRRLAEASVGRVAAAPA